MTEEKARYLKITDEIRKEWFVNHGTMNGWGEEERYKYDIAFLLHERDKHDHPELHKQIPAKHNWNCWHEDNCSCGFCCSWDSGD